MLDSSHFIQVKLIYLPLTLLFTYFKPDLYTTYTAKSENMRDMQDFCKIIDSHIFHKNGNNVKLVY